ncbi:MAG: hypothetical protein PHE49_03310 [bacterium]|nr:hypothetical protein [bacterium]
MNLSLICVLITGGCSWYTSEELKNLGPDGIHTIGIAQKLLKTSNPKNTNDFCKCDRFYNVMRTPVLPNLIIFVFGPSSGIWDPPCCCHVGVNTITEASELLIDSPLSKDLYNNLIDSSDISRITTDTQVLEYTAKFLIHIFSSEVVWDNSKYIKINLYIFGDSSASESDYMPKVKNTSDYYWVTLYTDNLLFRGTISKWTFYIKRNGIIVDIKKEDISINWTNVQKEIENQKKK